MQTLILPTDQYEKNIVQTLHHIRGKGDIAENSTVLIVVDFSAGLKSLQSGAAVDPFLVFAMVIGLQKIIKPSKIIIGCADNGVDPDELFEKYGYHDFSQKFENVDLLNLSEASQIKYLNNGKGILKIASISELFVLSDYCIVFSNLKTHIYEKYSGCSYSLFSTLSNLEFRNSLMPFGGKIISDLYNFIRPGLSIIDARYCLQGTGPIQGDPKKLDKILIGGDPLEADVAACNLIGVKARHVPHLRYLCKTQNMKLSSIKKKSIYSKEDNSLRFDSKGKTFFFKVGCFFRRMSVYLKNFYTFFYLGSLALIAIGGRDLVAGRWMSFRGYWNITKDIITKLEEDTNLLEWKIVINKHVKEESLS